MDFKNAAEQIFLAGVEAVLPDKLIKKHVAIRNTSLFISSHQFPLNNIERIFVVGAGKASALMARELENILGDRISGGHLVVKYGHACALKIITVTEAGHPVPDEQGYLGTQKILEVASRAKENDLIICLLSGGGSSLLVDYPEGSNLPEIIQTNDLLLNSGADIKEINTVRKHLSRVKGGQLAKHAQPAFLASLILSDVIGDPLDAIASGPTVPDPTTFSEALSILTRYGLLPGIPAAVVRHLKDGEEGILPETPKPGDPIFNNTVNIVVGNNTIALEGARDKAKTLGMNPLVIASALEGQTAKVAEMLVAKAVQFQNASDVKKPCCLLFGGETTLAVGGSGAGGRNQHLALHAAQVLKHCHGITLLSGGTDGTDGPTNAAGAVVDSTTLSRALASGVDAEKYLREFDSFHFFRLAGGHIITGATMTNVMDMIVIVIE